MTLADDKKPIRVLVADDHAIIREGIIGILQMQDAIDCVGEAADGHEAVQRFKELSPDIVLMDLSMPRMDGIEAIKAIRNHSAQARVIVLTTYSGDAQASQALKAGAAGYLLKSTLRHELLQVIQDVHAGRRHVPTEIAQEIALHSIDSPLSDREHQILRLVAKGRANKEIAREYDLSEDTIKSHMKNIFSKLGVADRTEAVTVAIRRGIIVL